MKILLLPAALAALAVPCAATLASAQADDAPAATTIAAAPAAQRPRVGLVLGGGGAMGAAHIGVLKVLEELRVPVDCIAGTSMGALVGGAYAAGLDAGAAEKFIGDIDWYAVFGQEQVRTYQPIQVKRENQSVSNKLEFGLKRDGLVLPGGLVETQQIESLLREMVASQSEVRDFDRLPIPFRAVATDLVTGRMVVFDSGELPVALRASMSVPGAFAAVEQDGMLLVDGGISRNLPVDVARDTCADVVIAVAVDGPPPDIQALRSAAGTIGRMVDLITENNEQASLDSLGPNDIGLTIVLDDVTSADFQLSAAAVRHGEATARAAAASLSRYAVSDDEYRAWRTELRGQPAATSARLIAAVRFEGVGPDTEAYLASMVRSRPGDVINQRRIADDALRIYATGLYESVDHRIEETPLGTVVAFAPRPKSWGPTFVAFDYGIESSFAGDTQFMASGMLRHVFPDAAGREWRAFAQVGRELVLATDLRQPLGRTRRAFVLPRLGYFRELEDYYTASELTARYRHDSVEANLNFGAELGVWGEVQAGIYRRSDSFELDIGVPEVPNYTGLDDAGYSFAFERDTRDSDVWPTRGSRQRIEYQSAEPGLGADLTYQTALVEWNGSALFGKGLLLLDVAAGTDFESGAPPHQQFRLGGPGALSGIDSGRLRGADFAYLRLGLARRLTDVSPLLGMTLFAGAALEAGNTWRRPDGTTGSGLDLGGQLFVGGRTPFGPVSVDVGYLATGEFAAFLRLGAPVRGTWR